MKEQQTLLGGWGRTAQTNATLVDVGVDELTEPDALDRFCRAGRGAIARGLGRAYGDPAQNGGGSVIRLEPGPDAIVLDAANATVTAEGGVTLDALLRHIIPRGFFVPVTPGTRFVTVGGAIASDIHGKNHHGDLTFGRHVTRMRMLLADGTQLEVTPRSDPELWFATLGGMGLTGVILDATVDLLPVETAHCLVDTRRVDDFDTLIDTMERGDEHYRYSVAWIDLLATGSRLGRSVLTRADHATVDDLAQHGHRSVADPLRFDPPDPIEVPDRVPNVVPSVAVRAFNELWFRKAPREHRGVEGITGFFHPLDMVGHWNRLYGRRGFLQYQFVVPFEAVETLREVVVRVADHGHASLVAVLKRFGAESGGHLSFPKPGWTLTIDFPAGAPGLGPLLADLDSSILAADGRHYLAKDAHTTPDAIRAGYPRLAEWKAIRERVDPTGRWRSDQARRLELI